MTGFDERLFAWLVRFYPREFRERYRDDLLAFFREDRKHPKYGTGILKPLRFWIATVRDLARAAGTEQRAASQERLMITGPRGSTVSRLRQDLHFAWRGLRASPAVTLSALAILTLGIGAGASVFSVVDAVALRGLPFDDDTRIMSVAETDLPSGRPTVVAPQNYADWQMRQDAFESMGAAASAPSFALRDDPTTNLRAVRVTASLFDVLRVKPARGPGFGPANERIGAAPAMIISDRLWRTRFRADPIVVGRTVATAKSGEFTIVGVMPPGFSYPITSVTSGAVDVWLPIVPTEATMVRGKARIYNLSVVARLKADVTVADANTRMTRIRDALAVQYPDWNNDHGVIVRRLQDAMVGASVRSWMLLLLGAVMVVVLMACLNAANLLVARAVVRGPELAVRTALGASRWDLARSLLVESLLLSLAGAAGGVLLASWGVDVLRSTLPASVPRLAGVALDFRVVTAAVLTAIVSGAAFGTIPALQASRPDVITLLGQAGRAHSGGRSNRRLRAALVVVEVALAVVLLSGSGLFLTSFLRVTSVELGFDPRHVVTLLGATMSTSDIVPAETPEKQAGVQNGQSLVMTTLERIRAVPGVVAATATQGGSPLSGNWVTVQAQPAGRLSGPFTNADEPLVRSVGPEYLGVLDASLVAGRWIADTDLVGSAPVVVLSEEASRRYFGTRSPLGQGLLMDNYERTVVGVVRNMRWRGPESEIMPEVFIPFRQTAHPTAQLIVRTNGDSDRVVSAVQEAIRTSMPNVTVGTPVFLERSYDGIIAQRKFNMIILLIFGVVAVAIAAIGIYGLMSFLVAQRRREIGVRVALGAVPSGILSMMLGRAMRLMIAGLVPGILAAILLEQTARAFLFNAKPHDPAIYAAVAVVFMMAGLIAAIGPARRATRVDPLVALRQD